MEVEGTAPEAYDVIASGHSGQSRFGRYKGSEPA